MTWSMTAFWNAPDCARGRLCPASWSAVGVAGGARRGGRERRRRGVEDRREAVRPEARAGGDAVHAPAAGAAPAVSPRGAAHEAASSISTGIDKRAKSIVRKPRAQRFWDETQRRLICVTAARRKCRHLKKLVFLNQSKAILFPSAVSGRASCVRFQIGFGCFTCRLVRRRIGAIGRASRGCAAAGRQQSRDRRRARSDRPRRARPVADRENEPRHPRR